MDSHDVGKVRGCGGAKRKEEVPRKGKQRSCRQRKRGLSRFPDFGLIRDLRTSFFTFSPTISQRFSFCEGLLRISREEENAPAKAIGES